MNSKDSRNPCEVLPSEQSFTCFKSQHQRSLTRFPETTRCQVLTDSTFHWMV